MKYTILINQYGIVKAGLHKKTDLVDWAIIDYLKDWYFAEKKKSIWVEEDACHYVWVNYNHLIESLPLIGITKKDHISERFKKLRKLGLIKTFQTKDNTMYFILTPYCISTCFAKTTFSEDSSKDSESLDTTGFQNTDDDLSPQKGTGCPPVGGQGLSPQKGTAQIEDQSSRRLNSILSMQSPLEQKNPEVKIFIDYYHKKFLEKFGEKPVIEDGKDGKIVKRLLGTYGLEKLKTLLDIFFKSDDPFIVNSGYTIGAFRSQINKLLTLQKKRQSTLPNLPLLQ